jgi:hypothetical protein
MTNASRGGPASDTCARSEAADAERLVAEWQTRDQFDPNCWFGIPDFDVKPADVKFRGFYNPILYPASRELTESLRGLVRVARELVRKAKIETVRDLRQLAAEALAMADLASDEEYERGIPWERFSGKQRAAYSYMWCVEGLERYSAFALGTQRKEDEAAHRWPEGLMWMTAHSPVDPSPIDALGQIAFYSHWIAIWSHDGAKSALAKHMQRIASGPRQGARSPLKARISTLMRTYKADNKTFKAFLRAWESNGNLDELQLEPIGDGDRFAVLDERVPNAEAVEYTFSTLQTMYSESDKDAASAG